MTLPLATPTKLQLYVEAANRELEGLEEPELSIRAAQFHRELLFMFQPDEKNIRSSVIGEFRKFGRTLDQPSKPRVRVVDAQELKATDQRYPFGPSTIHSPVKSTTTNLVSESGSTTIKDVEDAEYQKLLDREEETECHADYEERDGEGRDHFISHLQLKCMDSVKQPELTCHATVVDSDGELHNVDVVLKPLPVNQFPRVAHSQRVVRGVGLRPTNLITSLRVAQKLQSLGCLGSS
jgi:hypothetical protein